MIRTIFLLRYIADAELRQTIHAATTKSERFNKFVQWVAFGGEGVIAENVRDEQRKFIKYNHLVANLLIFHNVATMTKAIRRMEADGHTVSDAILAVLSPYQTGHINRFGKHVLNFGHAPEPLAISRSPLDRENDSDEISRYPIYSPTSRRSLRLRAGIGCTPRLVDKRILI